MLSSYELVHSVIVAGAYTQSIQNSLTIVDGLFVVVIPLFFSSTCVLLAFSFPLLFIAQWPHSIQCSINLYDRRLYWNNIKLREKKNLNDFRRYNNYFVLFRLSGHIEHDGEEKKLWTGLLWFKERLKTLLLNDPFVTWF